MSDLFIENILIKEKMFCNKALPIFFCLLLLFLTTSLQAQTIITVAGTGIPGFSGDGGVATAAQLNRPNKIITDSMGNLYIADTGNNRIRKVDANGIISTIAGTGVAGFSGDGGPATSAELNNPGDIAISQEGFIFITDTGNQRIRLIDLNGMISTIAGNGVAGFNGDGSDPTTRSLNFPSGLFVFFANSATFADTLNNRIREVSFNNINTLAGTGVAGFSGDGGFPNKAELNLPSSVTKDSLFNIYIADTGNNRIRFIPSPIGNISTFAGNGVRGFSGDGGLATAAALNFPTDMSVNNSDVYIADTGNQRIRLVNSSGIISTFAGNGNAGYSGDGGPATAASLNFPSGVFSTGVSTYIADRSNNVIRLVTSIPGPTPTITSVSPSAATPGSQVVITGTNFLNVKKVLIGKNAINFMAGPDSNSLIALIPPGSGTVDVRVYTPYGVSPVAPEAKFTYLPFPRSPVHLRGKQVENRFATQTDFVNIITWKAPSSGETPAAYEIYRNSDLTELIATIPGKDRLRFKDHNRKKNHVYTYFIVSVDEFGNQSPSASVTIHPRN